MAKTLSREAEAALFGAGDTNAVVEAHLPYVRGVADRYSRGRPWLFDDLVQQGALGLMRATKRFDPALGFRFLTYAKPWVRMMIERHMFAIFSLTTFGCSSTHQDAIRAFRNGKATDTNAIAEVLHSGDHAADRVLDMLRSTEVPVHVTRPGSREGEEWIASESNPERDLAAAELAREIREALACLDARERDVIERRIMADEPEGLTEIGLTHGVSRERIRQIQVMATKKLLQVLKRCHKEQAA